MPFGKKYRKAVEGLDLSQRFSVEEAVEKSLGASFAKFDETVDVAIGLGVDPKYSDQMVRGAVSLPHGLGKTVRVAVFCKGEKEAAARRRNVVCKGVLASRLIGDQVARRGEKHIGGHRSADHQIDLHRVYSGFVQQVDDRTGAHVGGTYALTLEDMARLDADMRHDPFVGRIDHGAQLFIRKDVIRQILTYTRYRCCYFTH